jgi:hypothetical protein
MEESEKERWEKVKDILPFVFCLLIIQFFFSLWLFVERKKKD